ncbi:MAG TPA: hypothetical protein VGD64_02890 [Acidisarcina sp.]
MHSRSIRTMGRILSVACSVGLGSMSLLGQDASTTTKPAAPMAPVAAPISRIDLFAGYSYLAPHGTVITPNGGGGCEYCLGTTPTPYTLRAIDYGAIGSAAYFVNRYFGGQFEFGAHPDSNNSVAPSDHFYTGQIGPIVRYPTDLGFTPFVHALGGTVYGGGPDHQPYTYGVALTAGGGMDYDLPFFNHHLGLRLFQADYEYFHIDYGPGNSTHFGGRLNSNVARLSSGLLWHIGSIVPPPPVMYSCTVSPTSVFPGDPVTVTGTATNLNPKKTATYTWTAQGVTVKGDSATGTIDTSSTAPGTYTITGHVSEGQKPGMFADCTGTVTVKPFEPPTVSCSANPTTVKPGDSSTITATGVSPQNRPLTYAYSASAGQISGTGTTATLSTTGAPSGSITVTCNTADDKGQTASATTMVSVEAPPPPPAPKSSALCTINFERDTKRPARVDNEAKACLDSVALSAKGQADATIVVVGEAGSDEKPELAAQRAVNTKAYLTTEQGVDASRVTVKTGTKGTKEVESYLVPSGAMFDTDNPGTTAVDESMVKAQSRTAPVKMKKHHHHKHKKAM